MNDSQRVNDSIEELTISEQASRTVSFNYEEDENQRLEGLANLRRRIKDCRSDIYHLERYNDEFLLRFLRARHFKVDDSLNLLYQYHEFRCRNPSLFQNQTASQLLHVIEDGFPCVLPYTDGNGSKLMVIFAGGWDKQTYGSEDILKAIVLSMERLTEDEEVQLKGISVIADFTGWLAAHTSNLSIPFIRKVCNIFQDHFPIRLRGIHFVNEPWYLRAVLAVFKPFIKENIWKKIHVHGNNMSTLHSQLNPDFLPAEFGGNKPEVNQRYWASVLLASEKKHEHYVYGDNPLKWSINHIADGFYTAEERLANEFHEVRV